MFKKKILAILIPTYIISILLIIGCAFTSREVYVGRTMFIPLKSSPPGARVFLDGRQEGFTPLTLKFTYLLTKYGSHDDEIRKRILKMERDGYEPYILSFSITDKEYEKIPNPVSLKKSEDVVKTGDSLDKEHQKKQEAKEKVKESLKEITRPRKELFLLKEKDDTQKIKQNNNIIEASSDKDDKNIVQTGSDKKIDNTNKFIKKLTDDSQYIYRTIYTIQTGSFLKITHAQELFDSMLKILKGKKFSFLRIEKIGKYYSVRLGKFTDSNAAKQFIVEAIPGISNADILKAYIKEARIIRFNAGSVSVLNEIR